MRTDRDLDPRACEGISYIERRLSHGGRRRKCPGFITRPWAEPCSCCSEPVLTAGAAVNTGLVPLVCLCLTPRRVSHSGVFLNVPGGVVGWPK